MSDWTYEGWDFFAHDLGRPKRVLLSTYGFDPDFLVTELLSKLLQISAQRNSAEWFVEMEDALQHCPVDVVVDARQWAASNKDTLFQSRGGRVHPVLVSQGNQHAKLWLAEYDDVVRIAVGSANLTRSGFCGQIQYLWMTDLKTGNTPKTSTSLIPLQKFLKGLSAAIATSQGTSCSSTEKRVYLDWDKVLKTVEELPPGVSLIPVIPLPDQSNDNQVGVALNTLGIATKSKNDTKKFIVDIQVFSVGQLNQAFVNELKTAFHASTLNLLWPVASSVPDAWKGMEMGCVTAKRWSQLTKGNIYRLAFLRDVDQSQARLPHGKLYAGYQKGNKNYDWLLLGSSNLSETAWKHSFELNVLIKEEHSLTLPLDHAKYKIPIDPYCGATPSPPTGPCSWLEAYETSNGVEVTLHGAVLSGTYTVEVLGATGTNIGSSSVKVTNWSPGTKQLISCTGKDARRVAATPTSTPPTGAASFECPVIPLPDSQIAVIAPGKSPDEIRHEWILGYYGWDPECVRPGLYRTAWVEKSMNVFRIIDAWREAGKDPMHDDLLKQAFCFFAKQPPLMVGPPSLSDLQLQMAFSAAAQEIDKW